MRVPSGALRRQNYNWYEAHGIGRRAIKIKHTKRFALCIDNLDYEVDLIIGKVYPVIQAAREKDDFIRIIDESGEDYLYHKSHFVFVDFPSPVRKVILGVMPPNKPLQTDERRDKVIAKRSNRPRAARG